MIRTIDRDAFDAMLAELNKQGYETVGPTVRAGAIVIDGVRSTKDLPAGWTDTQDAATYRLTQRQDGELFGYALGPMSWKKYLFPPELRLLSVSKENGSMNVSDRARPPARRKRALIGVRSCELEALAIQDNIFLQGPSRDPFYEAERASLFLVAVQCAHPGGTCFCSSMGTGPGVQTGFDLCLTELWSASRHVFLVETGSAEGEALLGRLSSHEPTPAETELAHSITERAAASMTRAIDTENLRQTLQGALDHPRWDAVAARCLGCGNCTQVCPTCFCSTIDDVTDLSGSTAHRIRKWDTCFALDFSYIHGGSVRQSAKSRYRQWLLHKLANWVDQFGVMGCVGCGRCITWCPVGIDITEEAAALRREHSVVPNP